MKSDIKNSNRIKKDNQVRTIPKNFDIEVGKFLRRKRVEQGKTIDSVAREINLEGFPIGADKVRHMEKGRRRIEAYVLLLWTKVLEIDISEDPEMMKIIAEMAEKYTE